MVASKIIAIAKQYDDYLSTTTEVKAIDDGGTTRSHARWMCGRVGVYALLDIQKANRWLGFIQGYLWVAGDFTVDEMRHHNKAL